MKSSQKLLLWLPQTGECHGGQDPQADPYPIGSLVDNSGQQLQIEYPLGQLSTNSNASFSGSASEPYTGFSEMLQSQIAGTPRRQVGISGSEMGLPSGNRCTDPSVPFTSISSQYGLSLPCMVHEAMSPIAALSGPLAHHQSFEQYVRFRSLMLTFSHPHTRTLHTNLLLFLISNS